MARSTTRVVPLGVDPARLRGVSSIVGPPLFVLGVACGLWLAFGVRAGEIALFVAYEALYVVGPGFLVYSAVRRQAGPLERLAFGWAVGHALEIAAFALTAALGVRELFFAYPLTLVAAIAVLPRCPRPRADLTGAGSSWLVAAAAVVAMLAVAAALFPTNPLPWTVPRVTYFLDNVFQLSLAAEALHHWPLTNPTIAGEHLPYHTFVHMHMAAAAQTTGVALPVVVLRLVPIALVAAYALQMVVAGSRVGGTRSVGLVASMLVLFSGEIDLDARGGLLSTPFMGTFFIGLWYSPTFLLGLMFFVPLVIMLVELVAGPNRNSRFEWALFGILFAGACGAKAAIPPVVIGGLALFVFTQRRLRRADAIALSVATSVFATFTVTMYRGGDAGMRLDLAAATVGSVASHVVAALSWLPHAIAVAIGVVVGTVGLFAAPLSGLAWFAGRRARLHAAHVLLLCLFAVGLIPYFLIVIRGASQLFFMQYGYVAAALVSAPGVYFLWRSSVPSSERARAATFAFAVAWPVTLVVVSGGVALLTADQNVHDIVMYGVLASVLAVLGVGAARSSTDARGSWVRLLLIALLGASALNVPLDVVPHVIQESRKGTLYVHSGTGLTDDLYRGLTWVREHTRTDDVIAVSNYSVNGSDPEYDDVYYSAFTERRTFLEGWAYGIETVRKGADYEPSRANTPYARRLRLNERVFVRGDLAALRTLVRDYGVRYLLVDRTHPRPLRLPPAVRPVFANPGVAIYAVDERAVGSRDSTGRGR